MIAVILDVTVQYNTVRLECFFVLYPQRGFSDSITGYMIII